MGVGAHCVVMVVLVLESLVGVSELGTPVVGASALGTLVVVSAMGAVSQVAMFLLRRVVPQEWL